MEVLMGRLRDGYFSFEGCEIILRDSNSSQQIKAILGKFSVQKKKKIDKK